MNLLINYLSNYEIWIGLILPILLSILAFKKANKERNHYSYYLLFIFSLPISVWLSSWMLFSHQDHLTIGLNLYPIYIIFICLLNILTGFPISKYKAYALSVINLLMLDIFCAFFPSLVQNTNIFNYFDSSSYHKALYFMTQVYLQLPERLSSIGGNGFLDALFLYPLIAFILFHFLEEAQNK